MPALTTLLLIVALFATIGIWKQAGATSDEADATEKRACIESAEARYPAVSVSAFVTRDRSASGPLKLSFVRERQRAVAACD
ncbi:MAG TPA: hypothetical protein VF517_17955 [Thermoleophilaceae bacterium]|jgi:hypothetical protein